MGQGPSFRVQAKGDLPAYVVADLIEGLSIREPLQGFVEP